MTGVSDESLQELVGTLSYLKDRQVWAGELGDDHNFCKLGHAIAHLSYAIRYLEEME